MYKVEEVTVEYEGRETEVTVEYSVSGVYRPQTYWEPAEHPELEVGAILNIPVWADMHKLYELNEAAIEEACWEHFESEVSCEPEVDEEDFPSRREYFE